MFVVIGAKGFVGTSLCSELTSRHLNFLNFSREALESSDQFLNRIFRNLKSDIQIISEKSWIINCVGSVPKSDGENLDEIYESNVVFVEKLLANLSKFPYFNMINISTTSILDFEEFGRSTPYIDCKMEAEKLLVKNSSGDVKLHSLRIPTLVDVIGYNSQLIDDLIKSSIYFSEFQIRDANKIVRLGTSKELVESILEIVNSLCDEKVSSVKFVEISLGEFQNWLEAITNGEKRSRFLKGEFEVRLDKLFSILLLNKKLDAGIRDNGSR